MKRAEYETLQNIFFVGKRLVADECSRHHVVLAASIVRIITSEVGLLQPSTQCIALLVFSGCCKLQTGFSADLETSGVWSFHRIKYLHPCPSLF